MASRSFGSTTRTLALTAAFASALVACPAGSVPAPHVRFEIRGLKVESTESEYSTSFTHKATIVALGDSAIAVLPYLVAIRISRTSGGDPDRAGQYPVDVVIPVIHGVGDFEMWGGSREKRTSYQPAATWEPEKLELTIVGFSPMFPLASTATRTP
jgi:hypothetical protein